ncbi:uncharacterized protein HKW66_Vig0117120 [Vigna angularis]|uniref:Uncharacterized protein n=1 Tax=Phaseolus angularis TaxID=3914 RepID=A0A8T0JYB0_PHAAN|nr:uncharacterized protein HKW66_Vig0117120 [Vigna angularis]
MLPTPKQEHMKTRFLSMDRKTRENKNNCCSGTVDSGIMAALMPYLSSSAALTRAGKMQMQTRNTKALQVNLGVAEVGVELVPDSVKARPVDFDHDEGDGLVADDSEDGDNDIDHDVEEVAVVNAGGEVIAKVERVLLEERDADGDLGDGHNPYLRDHVVGDGEEERCVSVEEAPDDGGVCIFQLEGSRLQLPKATGDELHLLGVVVGGAAGSGVGDIDARMREGVREEAEKPKSHV